MARIANPFRLGPLALALVLAGGAARAADPAAKNAPSREVSVPDVPGDDIFGFTSPTDLGKPGDRMFVNENDFRLGKRVGAYGALNSKYEFSYTINEDWWIAASPFLAVNRIRDVAILPNRNAFEFDGFSTEIAHKLLTRSETNPFAVTATIEPRWGRIDPESGFRSQNFGFAAKLFVDRVVVPEQLFWAANLIWSPQWADDPLTPGNRLINSSILASTALSWQFSPGWFLGAEARYFAQYARIAPDKLMGQSLFVGPTLLWKINDRVAVNVTWQPQLWGRASATPGLGLDLDNFERSVGRLKLAVQF